MADEDRETGGTGLRAQILASNAMLSAIAAERATLARGASGEHVRALQEALKALGETINPTDEEANGGVKWYPYILINAQLLGAAGSTLVHELIHTTGLSARDHDRDPASAFYDNELGKGQAKRSLSKAHAARLRGMYYAETA